MTPGRAQLCITILTRALQALVLLVFALSATVAAAGQDDDFLAAHEAFRVGDAAKLNKYAARLKGHVLEPYVAYYQLRLRLEDADAGTVRAFLERHAGTLVAERMRSEWLKVLGKGEQWDAFSTEYPRVVQPDAELTCYALRARLHRGDSEALADARPLWFSGKELPASCGPLADVLVAGDKLSADDVWTRIRLALEAGHVSVARDAAQYLQPSQALKDKELAAADDHPQRFLEKNHIDLESRAGREMALFALLKLAKSSPALAYFQYTRIKDHFTDAERGYALGQIAYQAARRQDPAALRWFKEGDAASLADQQLAWRARAALRALDWEDVLASIEAMSESEQQEPGWRYWKARALKARGEVVVANAILAPLSVEHNFYGQLAVEEIGSAISVPPATYKASAQEVRSLERLPGIQRALALYRLGLRTEGTREWLWTIRGFDDRKLLAAAEVARRNELYDRAISAADRTVHLHDFELRYLAPYRDVMQAYTAALDLDEAYVYGLIRQESRFISDAKSSAGAQGLMQLMPKTARWAAKKIGMKYHPAQVVQVDTNLALGTWYLRYVLDVFDNQPVLAAAAYNAGPGRARQWRDARPMEGAIYAETIPFNETRDYVKKVLSNAAYYAAAFGQQMRSLKQRVGVISPPAGEEQPLEPEQ